MKTSFRRNAMHCEALALYNASVAQHDGVSHVCAPTHTKMALLFWQSCGRLTKCRTRERRRLRHAHFREWPPRNGYVFDVMGDAERDIVCVNAMKGAGVRLNGVSRATVLVYGL